MKKNLSAATVLFLSAVMYSQVGINNTAPKATLDITAKTDGTKPEGIMIPKLTGTQIHTASTTIKDPVTNQIITDAVYKAAQEGVIIYASVAESSPSGATINITGPGYYYFDGTLWQKILGGKLTGATNVAMNNNNYTFDGIGKVGIGTASPTAKLEVNNGTTAGAIKIVDGTEGAGKVLQSDANGVGTWKNLNFTHVRKEYSNSATFSTNYTPLTDFGAFTSPYTGQYEVIFHSFLRVAYGAGNAYQPRAFSFQVKNTHVTSSGSDVITKTNQQVYFYAEAGGWLATAIPLIISSAAGDKVEFELKPEVGGPFEIIAGSTAPQNNLDIFYLGVQ